MAEGPRLVAGRYALLEEFASGGMAAIHFGRQLGAAGFARTVAIKRLHPHLAKDPEFVAMFVDEARLAARVRHPNVVPTVDVVQDGGELLLVMEYVEGESLTGLFKAARKVGERLPCDMGVRIVCDMLQGLHAAHEAVSDAGEPLAIVHRDVSPSNVVVGVDGVARVLDFGVAKAAVRVSSTRQGGMKGKLRYMAPEQIADRDVTRRTDVYAAAVVLWELLIGEPLFHGSNEAAVIARILEGVVTPPSRRDASVPAALDGPLLRALDKEPEERFPSARAFAVALEAAITPASALRTGEWVARVAAEPLAARHALLGRAEGRASSPVAAVSAPHVTATGLFAAPQATATGAMPAPPPPEWAATEVMDGPTQLAAARQPPRPDKRPPLGWLVGGAILLAVAATAAAVTLTSGGENAAPAAASRPTATVADEETAQPSAAPTSEAALATEAPPEPEAPPPATVAATHPPPRIPKSPPPPAPPIAKPNCNPPYVIDAQGRRRVKRECL
jgi:eukaryotic-like serine/threonine-protein kinase